MFSRGRSSSVLRQRIKWFRYCHVGGSEEGEPRVLVGGLDSFFDKRS